MRPKINFITLAATEGIQEGYEDHCLFELEDDFILVLYRRKDFLPLTANGA